MHYLYGIKSGSPKLVATFSSEQLLLSYVRWATLATNPDGSKKFEQKTPLTGSSNYTHSSQPLTEDSLEVSHNPSPTML